MSTSIKKILPLPLIYRDYALNKHALNKRRVIIYDQQLDHKDEMERFNLGKKKKRIQSHDLLHAGWMLYPLRYQEIFGELSHCNN